MANSKKTPNGNAKTTDAEKQAKFKELGEARMTKALAAIQNVGKLSNPSAYKYSDEQVAKLVDALKSAVASVEARFKNKSTGSGGGFSL